MNSVIKSLKRYTVLLFVFRSRSCVTLFQCFVIKGTVGNFKVINLVEKTAQ